MARIIADGLKKLKITSSTVTPSPGSTVEDMATKDQQQTLHAAPSEQKSEMTIDEITEEIRKKNEGIKELARKRKTMY